MAKIYIGGAGGAPSNGFIRSLKESNRNDYILGASSNATDLFLANTDEKYFVPSTTDAKYKASLLGILDSTRPNFIHVQNDREVLAISKLRNEFDSLNIKYYLPNHNTIEACVNKEKSYKIWHDSGIKVPKTILIKSASDLKKAFNNFGPSVWIRATEGAAGYGALPTDNFDFAKLWIDRHMGWGSFSASELLSKNSITWLSLWFNGALVVAQTRKRLAWNFGDRTLSGVTGITGVGETCSDHEVTRISQESIFSIDKNPHGIFAVDLTYDNQGIPNPTEINIGRFFTTHYFFTRAGLNLPEIYCNIALDNNFPVLSKNINPLPDGLIWIRGMDSDPVLTTREKLDAMLSQNL